MPERSKENNTRAITFFGSAQLDEGRAFVRYGTLIASNYNQRFY